MTKKSFIISVITVFVQYYDYHLFGFLAANIASYFLPSSDTIVQIINAYIIMTISMIAKPFGALIIGKIGDLRGRSDSFKISLIGMSAASAVIFLTPSYESIGLISCFILLIYRMVICGLVSPGSDGVRIYIFEHIPESWRCLGVAVTTVFTQAGSLLASLSVWFFTLSYFPEYSWKIAFLLGTIMGMGVLITMKVINFKDTKIIQNDNNFEKFKNLSIIDIIKSNKLIFILSILAIGGIGSTTQFIIIFFGTYNFKILNTIDQSTMQYYISIALAIYMIFNIISGFAADHFNRYTVILFGAFFTIFSSLILILGLKDSHLNYYAFIGISASLPFIIIPSAATLKLAIPKSIRYRLFSLSHAIGSVIISAPTALISTYIYKKTSISWLPICYFIITILMIISALYYLNKQAKNSHDDQNSIK